MSRFELIQIRWLCLGMVCLGLTACSDNGMKPTFAIKGQVKFKNSPAKGAVVGFHPIGENAAAKPQILPNADCDEEGNFTLSTYNKFDGAPEGEYAVTIFWPAAKGKIDAEDIGDEEEREEVRNRLPDEYSRKEKTPLRFTVKAGDNEPAMFHIEK